MKEETNRREPGLGTCEDAGITQPLNFTGDVNGHRSSVIGEEKRRGCVLEVLARRYAVSLADMDAAWAAVKQSGRTDFGMMMRYVARLRRCDRLREAMRKQLEQAPLSPLERRIMLGDLCKDIERGAA